MNKIFSELYDLLTFERSETIFVSPNLSNTKNIISISEFRKLYADIFPVVKPIIQKKVQNIFMFHYILCINNNFENKINIVINFDPKTLTSSYDVISKFCSDQFLSLKSYNFYNIDETKNSCRIPNSVIKEWWPDPYEFNSTILKHLMSLKIIQESSDKNWGLFCLKIKISEIMRSKDNVPLESWVNSISNRLMNLSSSY